METDSRENGEGRLPFATDMDKLAFLLEADAELWLEQSLDAGVLEAVAEDERPKYITNYIGSKQKLTDWIWKNTPEGASSVLDAFSGSAVVAYMYKTKGLRVLANDRLRYCFHAARAIIENDSVTLSDEDAEKLLADTPGAGTFVRDNFKGIFFAKGVHRLIDQIRANIDALSGYKKDIALFALGKTCTSGKGGFGHFSSTTPYGKREDTPEEFKTRLRKNIERINALVFDNGKECKAHRRDVNELLPEAKADLVYFDPPYATEFSTTNYEKTYHFIEGLMTYWDGLKIAEGSKTRFYETDHVTLTQTNAKGFFEAFLGNAKHIPHWLISYRDHAYPTESQMKKLIAAQGHDSRMKSHDHQYSITSKHGEASRAKERLFICSRAGVNKAAAEDDEPALFAAANMESLAELSLDADFDPDVMSALAGKTDNVLVTGFIGNKHFIMNWIDKSFPKDAKSMFDAFSGGANVAYFYKRKGLRVTTNDIMKYPYHIARAVIENNAETISDEELGALVAPNPKAGTFIADAFYGYYYTKPILRFMDAVWSNLDSLTGYKRDIALAALGHTCKAKAVFGMFNRSKMNRTRKLSDLDEGYRSSSIGNLPLSEFVAAFEKYVRQINGLVYDNGQENKAYNDDVLKTIPRVKADVIYCDPPYITEFLRNDYEDYYHFVEGLMTRWEGKELLDTPRRNFASRTKYDKESIRALMGGVIAASAKGFPHILVSYRDKAFPTEEELKAMVADAYGDVSVKRVAVEYNIVKKESAAGGKYAKELLVIGNRPRGASKSQTQASELPRSGNRTVVIGDISPHDRDGMAAEAISLSDDNAQGDKEFSFILTHAGANRNGDFFTVEELSARHQTAINKKIDLKHSQDFTDIVGGVIASDFMQEGEKAWVECVGELYTHDNINSRLAYKLIKKGVITQVSMECDYEEGECSVCGKRVHSKADYCMHLKKYKGGEFKGRPVHEILHGITFTGLGLLDRKGADENAKIKQVAQVTENPEPGGNSDMEKENESTATEETAAVKKAAPDEGQNARVDELEKENRELKSKLDQLQVELDKLKAEREAAIKRARAEKLVVEMENRGMGFADAEDRDSELTRLAGLSDDAFSATEAAVKRVKKPADSKESEDEAEPEDEEPQKKKPRKPAPKSKAEHPSMRADAALRPFDVDDVKQDLETRLTQGFMAAYRDRVGAGAN